MAAPFSQSIEHPELTEPGWSVPLGPYFAFAAGAPADDAEWTSVSQLSASDELIRSRSWQAARTMGSSADDARTLRAAASTMALGLLARLLSPTIGATLLDEAAPAPDPAALLLRHVESGPIPLRTSRPVIDPDAQAAITEVALPLADGVRRATGVSSKILLGDIAAAVVGACHVVAMIRPEMAARAEDLRADLLGRGPLRGAGTTRGDFVRTSCCLIYQLPMGYICSNCVLVGRQTKMVREREAEVAGSPNFRYRR